MAERLDPAQSGPDLPVSSILDWLEEDHRQLRARVGHLDQEVAALQVTSRDQALRQRADSAELEALRQHLNRVPSLEEGIRQAQEDIGDVRALQTQLSSAQERAERTSVLELERIRIQIAEAAQRLSGLVEEVQPLPIRLQALGDHTKRQQDHLTAVQQVVEEIVGRQASLQSKIDLSVEQARRVEQALGVLGNEFAPLRREDEVLASRIQLAMDLARQVEQKMADVLVEEQARRELAERVEILRVERQRLQQQVADLEHAIAGLVDRAEELARQVRQEIDRRQVVADRLAGVEGRLLDVRQTAIEAIIQIWQTAEIHKREEIVTLQEQAKDLRETLKRLTRPLLGGLSDDDAAGTGPSGSGELPAGPAPVAGQDEGSC